MASKLLVAFLALILFPIRSHATEAAPDTMSMEHMHMHGHEPTPPMPHAHSMSSMTHEHEMSSHPLGYPEGREGSGTSWLPDRTRTHHLMTILGGWTVMGHGAAFLGYDRMNGSRGD